MNDVRRMLSAEERAEYDALLYEAGYDELGRKRPSAQIGPRMRDLLEKAVKAGRAWANWIVVDDQEAGHLKRFKRWDRQKVIVQTRVGESVVPRAGAHSVRKMGEDGQRYWQDTFWPDMSADDLLQIVNASQVRQESEAITQSIARKLLRLVRDEGTEKVSEALERRGTTLDEFLTAQAG